MRLQSARGVEKFNLERFAIGQFEHSAVARAARRQQHIIGFFQQSPVRARSVGDRRHIGLAKHFIRHFAAIRLQQCQLCGRGLAFGHHGRALKIGGGAAGRGIHDVFIGPFEIKHQPQRLADAWILECVAAQIVKPALNCGGNAAGQRLFFHAAILDRRKIIACGPNARGIFLVIGDCAVFKGLESHLPLAEIFIADGAKIILPHING